MQPVPYEEGPTSNNGGSEAGEASTQSGERTWTHSEDLCAVLHDNGCKACEDWKEHHGGESDDFWFAQKHFYCDRDERLDSTRVRLEKEIQAGLLEAETLRRQIGDSEAELKSRLQAAIEDTRRTSPSHPSSRRPEPSSRRPEPSSHRPHKRQRRTRTASQRPSTTPFHDVQEVIEVGSNFDFTIPSQAVQEVIDVDDDSDSTVPPQATQEVIDVDAGI